MIGDPIKGQAEWAFTQSTSGIIIAVLSPFLGAMADAGGRRKPYIFFFQCLVAIGCFTLWWAYPHRPELVSLISWAVVVATIGAEMSIVFNNSLLPTIVRPERMGWLSGLGWGLGYCGGLLALFAVLIVSRPSMFGLAANDQPLFGLDPETYAVERLVGPASVVWLALFVIPMFLFTPDGNQQRRLSLVDAAKEGGRALLHTVREAPPLPQRAALPARLHALQRRPRRHHRLRRHLCRGDLRMGYRDHRHLRHHRHDLRHSRRLPGRVGRRPHRQQADGAACHAGRDRRDHRHRQPEQARRALLRAGTGAVADARPVRFAAGAGVHGLRAAVGLLHGADAGGEPHHDRPAGAGGHGRRVLRPVRAVGPGHGVDGAARHRHRHHGDAIQSARRGVRAVLPGARLRAALGVREERTEARGGTA